ncbi:MAG: 3'-5' exonuclease [Tessaracoccus sp.]|uniref:exonuclease domain-containing protein n=1 Tax=Tessaracoccus sp. TaxID=1971211 RepID=UPI001ECC4EBA|nr:exonuclease domain-containing protein [Tessaracoccus sp.]MBK7822853.1 3'-5' exonuclease [Tessaracoccus sp.]
MSWLADHVAALDTETTGVDVESDRVVTACLGYSGGVGAWAPVEIHINPGVPIPAEASAVHGITDSDVADWAVPAVGLSHLYGHLRRCAEEGTPVVGFNLAYDLTLLDREFRRHLGKELPYGLLVLDVLVLWRRLERETGSRRLSLLAERHGIVFPAHDATADALASLRLLHILADRHDFLPHISLPSLYRLQEGWYAHQVDAAYQARLGRGDVAEPPSTEWPMRAFAGGDT